MKIKFGYLLILILITTGIAVANDGDLTTWPIIERCLPDPIAANGNWTFDGEILMRGWAGIHGVSAAFDTPYVVHWGYGIISPNGQWALNQDVETFTEQLSGPGPLGRYHRHYGDIVVTNVSTRETRSFPWEVYITMTSRPYLLGPAGPLWLDNTQFVSFYGTWGNETRIGDIETGEVTIWEGISLDDYELSISPDRTRVISNARLYDLSDNSLIQEQFVAKPQDFIVSPWSADSSMFIDLTQDEADGINNLSIFDRDGNIIAIPFVAQAAQFELGEWSPTNDYFIFHVNTFNPSERKTYMLSFREQVIYHLCGDSIRGWGWSSDGMQFATIIGKGHAPVVVVDLDEWQPYTVAYHTGRVIMWRSD